VLGSEFLSGQFRDRELQRKYSNQGKITTLMFRNIPTTYTQDMLLEEIIDCMGSSDEFDFFYLPWDQQNDSNIGYGFINFRTVGAAERCTRIFTNFTFRKFDSPKCCRVFPAHIQGLENNVLHLSDRVVSEARSHYPIIMWKGQKLKLGQVIAMLDGQCTEEYRRSPLSAPVAHSRQTKYRSPLSAPNASGLGNRRSLDQPWAGAQAASPLEETTPIFEEDQRDQNGWDSLEAQLASCLRRHRQEMAAKQCNEMTSTSTFCGAEVISNTSSLSGCQDKSDRVSMDAFPVKNRGSQHNKLHVFQDPLSWSSGMELPDDMHVIEPRNPTAHVLHKFWQKFGR